MYHVRFLSLEPTTKCNYNCVFCASRHFQAAHFSNPVDLAFPDFTKIVEKLPYLESVHLQGYGEPFLNVDIYKMIKFLKEKGIVVTTTTNGSLLNESNIEKLLQTGIDHVGVSLESPYEKEFSRIRRGGNLRQLISGIEQLTHRIKEKGLQKPAVGFCTTVMKSTMKDIEKIFTLYGELEMDGGILTQPLRDLPKFAEYYDESIKNECLTYIERIALIKKTIKCSRKILLNKNVDIMSQVQAIREYKECSSFKNLLYVNALGYATLCSDIYDYGKYSLGSLLKDDLDHIMNNRQQKIFSYENGRFPEECIECISSR